MSGQTIDYGALLDALIGDMRVCIGTRWKCDSGHEWVSAHGDRIWFQMPTACPECGQQATAHRGEWKAFRDFASNADYQHGCPKAPDDRYNELLYAVTRKFPHESRHETALRYIREAEEIHSGPCMQNAEAETAERSEHER
jgi:hypothetical protein